MAESSAHGHGRSPNLTSLCCTTETTVRASDHAILAHHPDRPLVRLLHTPNYQQLLAETYCMSLADRRLHITVHPRCVGHCRQVREAVEVLVVDEHGEKRVARVWTNAGCSFAPL